MKRLAMILAVLITAATVHAEAVKWQDDFDKALAAGKKDGKLVVVDVYADWCGWCKKLDREVYADPKVGEKLVKNFVTVKINPEKSSRAAQLARQFGTTGYPHIVFVNGDGKKIGKIVGYVPADKFLKQLDKIARQDPIAAAEWFVPGRSRGRKRWSIAAFSRCEGMSPLTRAPVSRTTCTCCTTPIGSTSFR